MNYGKGQTLNPFKSVGNLADRIHKARELKFKKKVFNHKVQQDNIRNNLMHKKIKLGYDNIKARDRLDANRTARETQKNNTNIQVAKMNSDANIAKANAVQHKADKENEMNKRDNRTKTYDRQETAKKRKFEEDKFNATAKNEYGAGAFTTKNLKKKTTKWDNTTSNKWKDRATGV